MKGIEAISTNGEAGNLNQGGTANMAIGGKEGEK
jgi:hypothetical protein